MEHLVSMINFLFLTTNLGKQEEDVNENGPTYENFFNDDESSNERLRFVLKSLETHRGKALFGLLLFILFSIFVYFVFGYFSYTNAVVYDNHGNLIVNVYNLSSNLNPLDITKNKNNERPPVKTKEVKQTDIEKGYFSTYVYNVGYKNITFNDITAVFSKICKKCICVGTYNLQIHSNILFLNRDEEDILLIEPRIESYSRDSQNAMLTYIDKDVSKEALYLPNYRAVPQAIVVHFININGNLDLINLAYKESACVYLVIEQNKKYL